MIGGDGPYLGGERGAATVVQLIGVQFGTHAVRACDVEDAARFGLAERGFLDEDIAEAREFSPGDFWNQRRAEEFEIGVASIAEFWRHDMRAEKGRDKTNGLRASQRAID